MNKKALFFIILNIKIIYVVNSQSIRIDRPYITCQINFSYYGDVLNVESFVYNASSEPVYFRKQLLFNYYYYKGSLYQNIGWSDREDSFLTIQELKPHDTIQFNYGFEIDTNVIKFDLNLIYLPRKNIKKRWIKNGLSFVDYYCNKEGEHYMLYGFHLEKLEK